MPASLSLHQVSVSRGPRRILAEVDLLLAPGRRVGVVGPNGVGKSTLLGVCAGAVVPDRGEVRTTPPSATVGLLAQEPDRSDETVATLVRRRAGVADAEHEFAAAAQALADGAPDGPDRYDRALARWTTLGAATSTPGSGWSPTVSTWIMSSSDSRPRRCRAARPPGWG